MKLKTVMFPWSIKVDVLRYICFYFPLFKEFWFLFADVEKVASEGGLNDLIGELKSLAAQNSVPCFFVLNRKLLGRACMRKVGVSAIGILNYQVRFRIVQGC